MKLIFDMTPDEAHKYRSQLLVLTTLLMEWEDAMIEAGMLKEEMRTKVIRQHRGETRQALVNVRTE